MGSRVVLGLSLLSTPSKSAQTRFCPSRADLRKVSTPSTPNPPTSPAISRLRSLLLHLQPSYRIRNGCLQAPPTGRPRAVSCSASSSVPTCVPRNRSHSVNCGKERICLIWYKGDDCPRGAQRGHGRGDGAERQGLRARRGGCTVQWSVRHYLQAQLDSRSSSGMLAMVIGSFWRVAGWIGDFLPRRTCADGVADTRSQRACSTASVRRG
jgi:hypothetical protein